MTEQIGLRRAEMGPSEQANTKNCPLISWRAVWRCDLIAAVSCRKSYLQGQVVEDLGGASALRGLNIYVAAWQQQPEETPDV